MTHLHFHDLRRRLDALEDDWAWTFPHVYEWADDEGNVYKRFENKAYRLWLAEHERHQAVMARLEAALDEPDCNDAPCADAAFDQAVPPARIPAPLPAPLPAAVSAPPFPPAAPCGPVFSIGHTITPRSLTIPSFVIAPRQPAHAGPS